MTVSVKPTRPSAIGSIVALLFAFAFVGVIGSCLITIGIWPGQIKLLAPVLCSDAQPDAFVVADTYNPSPGETVTNFTLYCMGERGDATDQGFLVPFLLISVVNGLTIFALVFMVGALLRARRRTRPRRVDSAASSGSSDGSDSSEFSAPTGTRSAPPSGSTAGPFVD